MTCPRPVGVGFLEMMRSLCARWNRAGRLAALARMTGWMTAAVLAAGLGLPCFGAAAEPDTLPAKEGPVTVHPVQHASLVLSWNGKTVVVDPVGGAALYAAFPKPDVILLTDIHADHFNKETLAVLAGPATRLGAPAAVVELLSADLAGRTTTLALGTTNLVGGLSVETIAAYNTTQDRVRFHARGRGNGYVLTLGGARIYVSGDTEDVPEMLALKDIAAAFVCMNLPYTMTPAQAARSVKAFRPAVVYPYHSRGSDLEEFKRLVAGDSEVRLRNWYPAKP